MLSVIPMVKPSDLNGVQNGKLWPNQLAPISLPGVGMGTLHPQAARCMNLLFLAALQETGVVMSATSNGDDYRSYEMQLAVFLQRYTPTYLPIRNVMTDRRVGPDGKLWYKRASVAAVASPGTSNHGWGLALDCAIWNGTKIVAMTSNKLFAGWLSSPDWFKTDNPWRIGTGSNAESFGFSWEMQSEFWHLRYVMGDNTPRRVLDTEAFLANAA